MILFDFDGVLLNSVGATEAIKQMMKDPYFEWDYFALKKIKPLDLIKRFERYDSSSNFRTVMKFYKEFSDILPARYKRLRFFYRIFKDLRKVEYELGDFLPGIEDIIEKLYNSGFILGICTNSQKKRVNFWLTKKSNIHRFIRATISRDSKNSYGIKPDPRMILAIIVNLKRKNNLGKINRDRIFFVGDGIKDIRAAKNARIKSIAVLSGHATEKEILKSNPDFVIDSLSSISEIPEIKKEMNIC